MAFKFRRSKKIGPVNLTVSGAGIGVSVGVKGARIGRGADGKVRASAAIPGTGLSYRHTFGSDSHRGSPDTHPQHGAHAPLAGGTAPRSGVSWKGLAIVGGAGLLALVVFAVALVAVAANRSPTAAAATAAALAPKPAQSAVSAAATASSSAPAKAPPAGAVRPKAH